MKIANTGNSFRIYDSSLKISDGLPAQSYIVRFDKNTGFFLETYSEISINEKIYGVHSEKVDKVMKAFKLFKRNLGVILSGDKGIGKSLCAKMLASRAISDGYPLIVINGYIPGIADFLNTIEQEVVILFDEFDKTFASGARDNMHDPQSEMLTLFDGLSMGKKMFVITCNELGGLSNYLVNRPGRFHYHFRFDYPTSDEICSYLKDKIGEPYYGEIDKVIAFSKKINLNYDCLRAIAFELALGNPFEAAIRDLNIMNISFERYTVIAVFTDGSRMTEKRVQLDMFDDERTYAIDFEDQEDYTFRAKFSTENTIYNYDKGGVILPAASCEEAQWTEYWKDSDEEKAEVKKRNEVRKLDYLIFKKEFDKSLHYKV